MNTRLSGRALVALAAFGLVFGGAQAEDGHATPDEVVAKVREAAAYLAETGNAGLPMFAEAVSPFVWKDTYVFVLDCADDITAAHPVNSNIGRPVSTLKDVDGKPFGRLMCEAAAYPNGGWVEYMWPRAIEDTSDDALEATGQPSRKITFVLSVPGQPYQVGAGDYDETLTVEDLEKLIAD